MPLDTSDPPKPKAFNPASDSPVGGEAVITSRDVYDELGNKHIVYFRFFLKPVLLSQTQIPMIK